MDGFRSWHATGDDGEGIWMNFVTARDDEKDKVFNRNVINVFFSTIYLQTDVGGPKGRE